MSVVHKEVGPNRYRESFGRYYEDFNVGDVYEHRPGRTISEADNTWFTLLTMNTHPLHFDAEYGAKSEFGQRLVNSALTLSIVVGMSVSDLSQKVVANLGWDKIRLTAPVFIGDTIYAESEVLDKRERTLGDLLLDIFRLTLCAHRSIVPSLINSALPVSQTGAAPPRQLTTSCPPGSRTATSSSSRPSSKFTSAAAPLIKPSARMKTGGKPVSLMGKFSIARCVCAP